jgi:hypothetical protein
MAPVMFLNLSFLINSPGWVSAGHPSEQGASWHRRQRSASAIAWANPNPLRICLNLFALLTICLLDIFSLEISITQRKSMVILADLFVWHSHCLAGCKTLKLLDVKSIEQSGSLRFSSEIVN